MQDQAGRIDVNEWTVIQRNGRYRVIDHDGAELFASEYTGQAHRIVNSHNKTCEEEPGMSEIAEMSAMEAHILQAMNSNSTVRIRYKHASEDVIGKIAPCLSGCHLFYAGSQYAPDVLQGEVHHHNSDISEITTLDELNPLIEQAKEQGLAVRVLYEDDDKYVVGTITANGEGRHVFQYFSPHNFIIKRSDRQIREIAIWTEPEPTPLGEQVWNAARLEGSQAYNIFHDGVWIADARTEAMRDAILGIPALVKVCQDHCDTQNYDQYQPGSPSDPILHALKAMGVE